MRSYSQHIRLYLFLFALISLATVTRVHAFTPTPIAGAVQATVAADTLRVRSGPGTEFSIVGSLVRGDQVQILARNADSTWWQIAFPDSVRRAWVASQFIAPAAPTGGVPLATTAPPTPTRTLTSPANTATHTLIPSTGTPTARPSDTLTPESSRTPTDTPLPSATSTPLPTATSTSTPAPSNTPSPSPTPPGRDPKRALFVTGTDQIILARTKIWYRYEYLGDRSPIRIAMDGFGVRDLELLIYSPDQVDANFNEPKTPPVGRGGGNRTQTGHDVFWTGSFTTGGTAYVAVVNNTSRAIIFRLGAAGTGVVTTPYQLPESQQSASANETTTHTGIRVETATGVQVQPTTPLAFMDLDLAVVRGNRYQWLREFYSTGTLLAGPTQTSNDPLTLIYIIYPAELGTPPFPRAVPIVPTQCTPPSAIGVVITQSIKLCPNATYWNLNVSGSRIGIFQDDANTALVRSEGRSFAITAVGNEIFLQGLKIQATTDPQDRGKWVCAYDRCKFGNVFVEGGTVYGGGISLTGSNSIIKDVTVTGGTIGVALLEGTDNFLVNNKLLYQTGWASYNRYPQRAQFLGNQFNFSNRDCRGPDGRYYSQGCETAGWICISCVEILLLNNECKKGGNCYYVSGDGGTPSFGVRFIGNTCYAAPNNCYEATFSRGIYFEGNIARRDPFTGEQCNYPFWIGGSEVVFGKGNDWACLVSANTARMRSEGSLPESNTPSGPKGPGDLP